MRMWSTKLRSTSRSTCRGSALCTGPKRTRTCTDRTEPRIFPFVSALAHTGEAQFCLPFHSFVYVLDSEVVFFSLFLFFVFMSKNLHYCPRISPGFVKRTEGSTIQAFSGGLLECDETRGGATETVFTDCLTFSFLLFFFCFVFSPLSPQY